MGKIIANLLGFIFLTLLNHNDLSSVTTTYILQNTIPFTPFQKEPISLTFPSSALQRRGQRQRALGQVVQQVLAVPGRLPPPAALPRDARLRQAIAEVRGATDGGLRRTDDAVAPPARGGGRTEPPQPAAGCHTRSGQEQQAEELKAGRRARGAVELGVEATRCTSEHGWCQ